MRYNNVHFWMDSNTNLKADTLYVSKTDEVYMTLDAENSIRAELHDYFSFRVPGAHFMPAVRNKVWDGQIRLYNPGTRQLYLGLLSYLYDFAKERKYKIECLDNEILMQDELSANKAKEFVDEIKNLPFTPTDYQVDSLIHCVRKKRCVIVSPTASGKSFIFYLLARWFSDKKFLIIVPTISLVKQMTTDFINYGYEENDIHQIHGGLDKNSKCRITVSTWQSLQGNKVKKDFFENFDVVIGDECHQYKAQALTSIMTKFTNCAYRYGFTGSLNNDQCHRFVIEGLFGKAHQFVTTKELMERNIVSDLNIKCIVLGYSEEERKAVSKMDYQSEIDFIVRHEKRNRFIKNLALSLESNSLLLFQFVEKHGKPLFELINKEAKNRKVYFVYAGTDGDRREEIRRLCEVETNSIIIASYGTFSTGVNIKNIHNILFCSPSKSRIRNLQSIGRGLRTTDGKEKCTLFDISDNLQYKKKVNATMNHLMERIKIYNEENFDFKLYNVRLTK